MPYVVEDKKENLFYAGKADGWVEDLQKARVYKTQRGAENRANKIPGERQKEAIKEVVEQDRFLPGEIKYLMSERPEIRETVRNDPSVHRYFEAVEVEQQIAKVE